MHSVSTQGFHHTCFSVDLVPSRHRVTQKFSRFSQIPRAERQNNQAVNVFGWDKGAIVHHISKQPEDIPRINMLLIEKAGKTHFTRIKNINRLLYDNSKHKERKHFCERCLHGYTSEDQLEAHKPECRGIG